MIDFYRVFFLVCKFIASSRQVVTAVTDSRQSGLLRGAKHFMDSKELTCLQSSSCCAMWRVLAVTPYYYVEY